MNDEKMPVIPIEGKRIVFKGKPLVVGKQITPLKLIIYGPNGVGKSTFASHFKSPIFIDLEQKSDHLEIHKQPIETFEEFIEYVKCLIDQDHDYSTVVIDSLNQLEAVVQTYIEDLPSYKNNPQKLEYGRLNDYIADQFSNKILKLLNILFDKKKMNVIFIGHETIIQSNDTRYPLFDRYDLQVNKKASAVLRNWAYCIFFANYEINFEKEEKTGFNRTRLHASSNDRRFLYTTGTPGFLASNIYNLPRCFRLAGTKEDYHTLTEAIKSFYINQKEEGEK